MGKQPPARQAASVGHACVESCSPADHSRDLWQNYVWHLFAERASVRDETSVQLSLTHIDHRAATFAIGDVVSDEERQFSILSLLQIDPSSRHTIPATLASSNTASFAPTHGSLKTALLPIRQSDHHRDHSEWTLVLRPHAKSCDLHVHQPRTPQTRCAIPTKSAP